jgi:hypothetical protein
MKRGKEQYPKFLEDIKALGPNSSHDPTHESHKIEQDALPDFPFHKSSYTDADDSFKSVLRGLKVKVETGVLKDPSLAEDLPKRLSSCSSPAYGKHEVIAFYGRTGQGKSAAVGSLLGDDTLTEQVPKTQLLGFSAHEFACSQRRDYHACTNSVPTRRQNLGQN